MLRPDGLFFPILSKFRVHCFANRHSTPGKSLKPDIALKFHAGWVCGSMNVLQDVLVLFSG
jgi:hypothetical protein